MTEGGGSFFGRRKGKRLRLGQRQALEAVVPALLIDTHNRPSAGGLSALFPVPVDDVRLEIGIGSGEHLLAEARLRPRGGFIGVEPFENGLAKAAVAIRTDAIPNVRLYDQDAVLLLDWLPSAALTRVDLLFPDPWPKKRHWKRRFVNAANLDRIARCLSGDGIFRFATDVADYAEWTREAVAQCAALELIESEAARELWADWPGTRYQTKAEAQGRGAIRLAFRRIARDGA